jgi:hypothetical protein
VVEAVGGVVICGGGGVGGGYGSSGGNNGKTLSIASYFFVHPAIQTRISHDERGARASFVTRNLEPNPDAILLSIFR